MAYYSALNVSAVLDGREVRGWWDGDDAITVEYGTDVGAMLIGADGTPLFSQFADRHARITLRLQHTSPTHRQLTQKMEQQRAGRGQRGFPFSFIDRDSNEGGAADQCYIMTAPTDSKGRNATTRDWVLVTGEWKPEIPNG